MKQPKQPAFYHPLTDSARTALASFLDKVRAASGSLNRTADDLNKAFDLLPDEVRLSTPGGDMLTALFGLRRSSMATDAAEEKLTSALRFTSNETSK